MLYLVVLALAAFFVWECLARPLVGFLCVHLPVPEAVTTALKALAALGVAYALDRWVGRELLTVIAAASAAGLLRLVSRMGETPQIATVARGRSGRGMPMPGP